MVREASKGIPPVNRNFFTACIFALSFAAAFSSAQPANPAPTPASSDEALFAAFPTIPLDLATKPPVWPPRKTLADSKLNGLCRDLTLPILKPAGGGVYFGSADVAPERIAGGPALVTWANLPANALFRSEDSNSFRYTAALFIEDPANPKLKPFNADMTFEFLSARDTSITDPPTFAIDRTLFSLFQPAKSATPRGTLLFIPGMFGTPEGIIESLTKRLRADGWAVLRMWAHPARFTESMNITLTAESPLAEQVAPWALEFDQRAAETAYAAEAAFAHVFAANPELAKLPRAAIGFSGGAMVMSTVLAREPGAYSCAVLAGGGADFWIMNERSNYASMLNILHVDYQGFEDVPAAKLAANDAYLQASTLDAYHTAHHIGNTKILIIQGNQDRAVPSPLGDVLWNRLSKPERWLRVAGHEFLFANLRTEYDALVEWIRNATPSPTPAVPASSAPPPSAP